MIRILCITLILCPYITLAQAPSGNIGVGQKMPAVPALPVYNSKAAALKIPHRPGRLTILHFFATGCGSCVDFINTWHTLKEQFGDSLQVILVTKEPIHKLQTFTQKRKNVFKEIPVIYKDTRLWQLFPYEYVSHLVWVNSEGTVAAITATQYATRKNIASVLQGDMPAWPVKKDLVNFNTSLPSLKLNDNNIPYSSLPAAASWSAFTRHMPDLPVGHYNNVDSSSGTIKSGYINLSIPILYQRILKLPPVFNSHIIINGATRDHFIYNSDIHLKAGWELQNTFCYELLSPTALSEKARAQKSLADVNFYTGTISQFKDTSVTCLVLKDTTMAGQPLLITRPADTGFIALRNIIYQLNKTYSSIPVIDGRTVQAENFIPFRSNLLQNLPALNQYLLNYGLVLTPQLRTVKALVIYQLQPPPFIHSPKLYLK